MASNLDKCSIGCLRRDAFNFTGAQNVTSVSIQFNPIQQLPQELLQGMPNLLNFSAGYNTKLRTLPEGLFAGLSQLGTLLLTGSANLGAEERLPDGLFNGLSSLRMLDLEDVRYQNLPNMTDLTVSAFPY